MNTKVYLENADRGIFWETEAQMRR